MTTSSVHLDWLPIEQAPLQRGQLYGPCLVAPGPDGQSCSHSVWDGDGWFTVDGTEAVEPQYFYPYPLPPPRD